MKDVPGTIYILHFEHPFKHARHYIGWTDNLEQRLTDHWNGRGSTLLKHVRMAEIGWIVAAVFPGTRNDERKLKNRGGCSRSCPICQDESPVEGPNYVIRYPSIKPPTKPLHRTPNCNMTYPKASISLAVT